jgi:general secretion pathway protein I
MRRHASSHWAARSAHRAWCTDVRASSGFGLLEVMVALAVVAIGVVALGRLVAASAATVAADAEATRALLVARTLLAEAAIAPPEPGDAAGTRDAFRFTRAVTRTSHPALRQVRVRVWASGTPVELLEVIRVPPG